MKKVVLSVFFLVLATTINYLPIRTITKIPAQCLQCLCIDAPTCSDVVVVQRGVPFASSYELLRPEYVSEPYKTYYDNKIVPLNILLNSLVLSAVVGLSFYVIKKNKKAAA